MRCQIVLLVIIKTQLVLSQILDEILENEWTTFKQNYNKYYSSPQEEAFRREIFFENLEKIAKFNREYGNGRGTFVQQINPFGDMLHHEFDRNLNGFNRTTTTTNIERLSSTFLPSANINYPERVDWCALGAVTSVKNQGKCAACWAFSAAGALEGQHFRKSGNLIDLSVQNLIDCTRPYDNDGCNGGLMDGAFQYVRDNRGIDLESDYPYEGRNGECRFKQENIGATCTGFVKITKGNEKALEIAVATIGPIAAVLDASRSSLQFYSNGIYYEPECKNNIENMNHAVLIVGYGVEPNGQKYWLIKNSYGNEWGIGGYMKLSKDANNHCGIATFATYPLV